MKANEHFILFKNGYSCHTHTVQVLLKSLTNDSQYFPKEYNDTISLIEVLNVAGYRTTWLSNQYESHDTPICLLAKSARRTYWLNNTSNILIKPAIDGVVLAPLQSYLNNVDKREVIFIHLMGCHADYKDRYPYQFEIFDSSYDNSMRYNDFVAESIFKLAQQTGKLTAFVYFSDHGEAPEKHLGHDSSRFVFEMARIPFYAWFSDDYIKTKAKGFSQLRRRQNAFFSNDMIYDTLIGIMDIKTSFYNSKQDLSSEDYLFNKYNLVTLYGKRKILDDPNINKPTK